MKSPVPLFLKTSGRLQNILAAGGVDSLFPKQLQALTKDYSEKAVRFRTNLEKLFTKHLFVFLEWQVLRSREIKMSGIKRNL